MRRFVGYLHKIIFSVVVAFTVAACDEDGLKDGETPEIRPLTAEEKFLIESSNDFALTLLNDTRQIDNHNVSLSPVSAAMALGIIGNAGSADQFESFRYKMGLPQLNGIEVNKAFYEVSNMLPLIDKKVKIEFTNSIWANYDLSANEDFYNTALAYFGTEIREFRGEKSIEKKSIDKWLMSKSEHFTLSSDAYDQHSNFKIINLSTLSGRMFDGIYSQWVSANFHGIDGNVKSIGMNLFTDVPVNASKTDKAFTMEVPIGNSNYFLKIISPDDPEQNVNLAEMSSTVNFRTANLLIPDIFSSYEYPLNRKLREFGVEKYLDDALFTNFANQRSQTHLSCINKSQINITGAKITGGTPALFEASKFEGDLIRIDRPFYYLIKERNTDLIVFEGKYFQAID